MKHHFRLQLAALAAMVLLSACGNRQNERIVYEYPLDTVRLDQARGFGICHYERFTSVEVYSPWNNGELLQRYYLVRDSSVRTPSDGVRVRIPLRSIAIASCTHVGFLDVLGQVESIKGVCSPHLIYNKAVREGAAAGTVTDLGDAFSINVERLVGLRPDAIMVNGYGQKDEQTEHLTALGIPVLTNNEWTEPTPLARAEWVKFVAAFYDCEALADTLYARVSRDYRRLASLTADISAPRPTILSGNNFRGTWYMPSGITYMGHLFHDAGADYFYKNDTTDGSLPLSIETVVRNFSHADVWVGAPTRTLTELREQDMKHMLFRAYQTGRVYNFLARSLEGGANDYWETGVCRPDLILSDLVKILYPEDMTWYDFTYASRLEP